MDGLAEQPQPQAAPLDRLAAADAATRGGDLPKAQQLWSALQEEFPGDPNVFGHAARALIETGRFDEAEKLISPAAERFPESLEVRLRHVEVPIFRQDWPEADRRCRLACDAFPDAAVLFEQLGRVKQQLMDLPGAEAAFRHALNLEPGRIFSIVALQHLVDRRLDKETSREAWAELCDRHPRELWIVEGAIYGALRHQDFSAADSAYDALLARFGRCQTATDTSIEILAGRVRAGETRGAVELRLMECLRGPLGDDLSTHVPKLFSVLADFRRIEKKTHRAIAAIARRVLSRTDVQNIAPAHRDLLAAYFDIEPPGASLAHIKMALVLRLHRFRTHLVFQGYYSEQDRSIVSQWIRQTVASDRIGHLGAADLYKLLLIALTLDADVCALFCRAVDRAFAGRAADLSTPLGAVLHAVRQRAAADERILDRSRSGRSPAVIARRLRIAVCVSGQLRGFRAARPTWDRLGLAAHDVRFFAHVWARIGRKFPSFGMEHEVFSGTFMEAYRTEQKRLGTAALRVLYPRFLAFFAGDESVDPAELRTLYGSEDVIVQDEGSGPVAGRPNMEKMYYKAQCCFQQALASGESFDLFLRIRPDFHVRRVNGWDWARVHTLCRDERSIIVERVPTFGNGTNYQMSDQFAVGTYDTMSIFMSAYSLTRHAESLNLFGFPRRFVIHDNFGWATIYGGIRALGAGPIGMNYALPFDKDALTSAQLRDLLLTDIGTTARQETDERLLRALEADMEKEQREAAKEERHA